MTDPYANLTTLNATAAVVLVLLSLATLVVPRRYATVPILVLACFVSGAQRIVVAGLDFDLLRILVLVGWVRILLRSEARGFRWLKIDTVFVIWAAMFVVALTLNYGTFSQMVFALGLMFNAVGMYFYFRVCVRKFEDLFSIGRSMAVISIPILGFFLLEHATRRNVFSIFGYVPAISVLRENGIRCQGAFSHPILAGLFWVGVLPIIAALLWQRGRDRIFAVVGIACSTGIVILAASSTPFMGLAATLLGVALFPVRRYMRWLRWGLLLTLVMLHLVMEMPVWHLLARANVVGGSTGWHRYYLIDRCIAHFGEWWLVGTQSTAHWGLHLFDVTNQYVLEAARSGFFSLLLFIWIIALAFGLVGRAWRLASGSPVKVKILWGLGVALFMHVVSFIAVSYFGQILLIWYATLGIIPSMYTCVARDSRVARTGLPRRRGNVPVRARRRAPGAAAG